MGSSLPLVLGNQRHIAKKSLAPRSNTQAPALTGPQPPAPSPSAPQVCVASPSLGKVGLPSLALEADVWNCIG